MVTTLYAGILGIIYIALSCFVIRGRLQNKINIGDSGNDEMLKRIRLHGNFIEYVPLALILIFLAEQEGVSEKLIHALGFALVMGRIMHPLGLYNKIGVSFMRSGGMILTFLVILVAAGFCIRSYFIF